MKDKMLKDLKKLENDMKYITKDLKGIDDSWTDHFNSEDPNDIYLRHTVAEIEDKLSKVRRVIQGIYAPVVAEGRLIKNSSGRYEIEGTGYYFTSGSTVEVLVTRWKGDPQEWVKSSVEHDGTDYYLTMFTGSMEGLNARVKEYPARD